MSKSKPIHDLTAGEHPLSLDGPSGSLEAIITIPEQYDGDYVAVICHPHSLHGGNIQNKVVTTVTRAFRDLRIPSIRFNFRGVGQSEGTFDQGQGETDDLRAVIHWVETQFPQAKLCLAGFSFGSFVAFQVSKTMDAALLITVAPPVGYFDYDVKQLPQSPWVTVIAEQDEIVAASDIYSWLDALPRTTEVLSFADSGHFFHGRLIDLRERLTTSIKKHLSIQ